MRASQPRILVPLDCSEAAEASLALAAGIALALGGRLRLLHVITPAASFVAVGQPAVGQPAAPARGEDEERATTHHYLTDLQRRLATGGITAESVVSTHADIGRAILDEAQRCQPALIALAPQVRAGISRWVRESVSEQVLEAAPIPVLLCPPHTAPRFVAPDHLQLINLVIAGQSGERDALNHTIRLATGCGAEVRIVADEGADSAAVDRAQAALIRAGVALTGRSAQQPADLMVAAGRAHAAMLWTHELSQERPRPILVVPEHAPAVASRPWGDERRSEMSHSMLVPLDGSAESEQALRVASALARRAEASLTLVHVHVPILNVYMGSWNLGGVPIMDERLDIDQRQREQEYLDAVRARLVAEGHSVSCVLLDGPTAPTLASYADTAEPDLVVMTTHGKGPFSRLWLGSVADRFIRHCCTPTLLIRPGQTPAPCLLADSTAAKPCGILIPLDGSDLAEQILQPARALGQLLSVEYHLLRVVEPVDTGGDPYLPPDLDHERMRALRSAAHAYLNTVAAELRNTGRVVHTHLGVTTQPAAAIIAAANRYEVAVIALATHGQGGVKRLVVGSVADKVVRGADMPVLVIHPRTSPDEPEATRG